MRMVPEALHGAKREKVLNDPELYKSFNLAAEQRKQFYKSHLTHANRQLTRLVEEGLWRKRSSRSTPSPGLLSSLLEATASFHNPSLS